MIGASASPGWAIESLRARLEPLRPGLTVELLAETDSTNTRLLERARAGDTSPCLLVCEQQTAGRGRLGRPWFSDAPAPQSGPQQLCFSLGLRLAPTDWSGLSLAVGVALAEALHARVRLKWPNDLWLLDEPGDGRKFGGVLIETRPLAAGGGPGRYAVVGVGINLAPPAARPGLDDDAIAGWRELEPQARAPELLARLAAPMLGALAVFETQGFAAFEARFAARDALAGRTVTTTDPEAPAGRADGVDATGALRLLTDRGLRLVSSGEVSVRPC
ncbi:MAG: biotin--[acetyl-CoA-carboxylase] ligase [Methylibium sp.]|uniref:biotin--[acetyl-CoA-carboxylase] ligase n=1 Tax=Methylibium sp. TaxID=2067992 RepID=UPI001818365C|nr:biotin--[acetyl-CoA-carboxylase] ligase [Methylibium sp.]MBA3598799.1 biotin--[acetyl-CoA-carboxylase] ligase [Methylibium sp.]